MRVDNNDELKIDALVLKRFEGFAIVKGSIIENLNLND